MPILPRVTEQERAEHERRKATAIVRYREWCDRHGIPWQMSPGEPPADAPGDERASTRSGFA